MTVSAHIDGVSVIGPGFADWPAAAAVLAGRAAYAPCPTVLPDPLTLPAAERRRTGRIVKLAIASGLEAAARAGLAAKSLDTVFSSSGADGDICHEICQTLATEDRHLSPTRFHNSVHNAPAGYWSIATGAMAASTTLCAYDAGFSAGLLESLTQVVILKRAVLLIACDVGYPSPLREKRPLADALGVAIALVPERTEHSIARLSAWVDQGEVDRLEPAALEQLRVGTPAGRALPLLALLARRESGTVVLEYLGATRLRSEVHVC